MLSFYEGMFSHDFDIFQDGNTSIHIAEQIQEGFH